MKILTKAHEIESILCKLLKKYKNYYIASAWASANNKAFTNLLSHKDKIRKMIIGTHFYQTHPDFIKEFVNNENVRFILNSDGIFHPKAYLFTNNNNDWECLIGSANFTKSALSKNNEIMIHFSSDENDSKLLFSKLMDEIEDYWQNSNEMTNDDYLAYVNVWKKNKRHLEKLGGKYGKAKVNKPIIKSKIFTISWIEYVEKVRKDQFHPFEERLNLLYNARKYFKKYNHFSDMPEKKRKQIAAFYPSNEKSVGFDWRWFGSMSAVVRFGNRINNNNENISLALDQIPLYEDREEINKSDFDKYVEYFKKAFPRGGGGMAGASRLLAMKRPDIFVCLDSKNKANLCEEFGIAKNIELEQYWDEIIERIKDSVWWTCKKPSDESEYKLWQGRAAMLDAIFYDGNS